MKQLEEWVPEEDSEGGGGLEELHIGDGLEELQYTLDTDWSVRN